MQPPPLPDEPTVRCHDCGRLVPVSRAERMDVEIGEVRPNFWLGWGLVRVKQMGRVDLCRRCADERDEPPPRRGVSGGVIAVIVVACVFVAIMLVGCFGLLMSTLSRS